MHYTQAFIEFISDEFHRIFLAKGNDGNYINAVFADVSLFWLVLSYHSHCILMS